MPLCGFNEQMLSGMERFHEELVEALLKKANMKKTTKETEEE